MGLYDFASILKNTGKIKEELTKLQNSLEEITVSASSGGGMVEVIANARMKIISIKIDDEIVQAKDKEMLEDLILSAVNQALQQAQEIATQKMSEMSGGLLSFLPDGFKFPGII
ncbi:YbaB/EbfC family nucleoid-associated protein [candidate division KSB1 bacterium]|nr:YbaB/EbfC family nucleoid-associated protein [candidate division KSB1 bacterium]